MRNPVGLSGAEHLLSHNDAVAAFGADKANFLAQALKEAGVPPATDDAIAAQNAANPVTTTNSKNSKIQSVPPNTACSGTQSASRSVMSVTPIRGSAPFEEVW